jgi:Fic family protein
LNPINSRAGKTVPQGTGYLAYVPNKLPPDPPILFDSEMIRLMSEADLALGQLSGVSSLLPNPDLFVAMYVKKEAVLSSQIEGIQCTLDQVLQEEADQEGVRTKDIGEVVNYVNAMNYGIERLETLPLSLRLIREIHSHLLNGVRGEHKDPGEFRKTQNWIGPQGCTLSNAAFVPPPVPDMQEALSNLELFMHDRASLPITIQCAILHAQFETIHPFLDGNGRVGRLLVSLMLHERKVLEQPLLYISLFLKQNRLDYYDRLMAVRQKGDWEGWVKFFLQGVAQVSREASKTAQDIVEFRENVMTTARAFGKNELALVDHLFEHPIMDIRTAEKLLGCSYVTAANALQSFVKEGFVAETTGKKRNKLFRFSGYLDLFERDELIAQNDGDDGSGGGSSGGPRLRM